MSDSVAGGSDTISTWGSSIMIVDSVVPATIRISSSSTRRPSSLSLRGLRGHKPFATLDCVASTFVVVFYNGNMAL